MCKWPQIRDLNNIREIPEAEEEIYLGNVGLNGFLLQRDGNFVLKRFLEINLKG